ncbi:uncharacterized protein LOC6558334 [Drosophila grimshawi]|uniref:GH15255 n=1 Tax=Drosophila grimshawi TaxID=7222 RepID=B4IX41_DROGR|nr:uncharacterized protein LOC6558334 [Drosophila grimshawi]EDV96347.1 GH15255 [Drosophila grimshawi]
MGGTRCIFRDCHVSSQRNPKMHFFKLPVRDPVLLEAWLKNCGNADILNVAREKLINRAVCARHFRYECFMNYKLDRLIPRQMPTLVRVSKELAWDMEHLDENGEATMVKLSVPKLLHLIPPDNFECPLGFTEDALFGRKYAVKRGAAPKPLLLIASKRKKEQDAKDNMAASMIDNNLTSVKTELSTKPIDLTASFVQEADATIIDAIMPTPPAEENYEDLQHKYDELKTNFDRLATENGELKQSVIKLEAHKRHLNNSSSSKPQLYNSIKKYLCPTMAALVRMEMFGSAERAWKQDERDFAKELLQLGEDVYAHCCDEWRFRLPSLRMTRTWLEATTGPDDDNDVEDQML